MWLWSEHLWIWVLMECHHRRGNLIPRFVNIRKYFCVNYLINVAGQVRNLFIQREWTSAEDDDLRNLRIHGQTRLQEEDSVWGGETVPTCSGERYFLCVRFSLQCHKYFFTNYFLEYFQTSFPRTGWNSEQRWRCFKEEPEMSLHAAVMIVKFPGQQL